MVWLVLSSFGSAMPTYQMIFLGNFADIDADESSTSSELATRYFAGKTLGTTDDPLHSNLVSVNMNDTNSDGEILTNNWSGTQEKISYSLNDGRLHKNEIDGAFTATRVEVTRQLPNGTTDKVQTMVRIFQDTEGNTFMIPPALTDATLAEVKAVTTLPIVSIKLPSSSYFKTDYNAAYAGRYDMARFVPCFAAGTMILTAQGNRRVETLTVGDLIWTLDHGLQPIRWIGRRTLTKTDLAENARLRPIRIKAVALGPGRPASDLIISPQHRVLVASAIAQRMFGTFELLVPACQLTEVPGIAQVADPGPITYIHLMFDRHQVLLSNGAETESFYPGFQAMAAIGPAAREILTLFPELRDGPEPYPAARFLATGRKVRTLARRHAQKRRALH